MALRQRTNNKENIINKIAIYSRKSKFTGKGDSMGNQVEMCKEYIKQHFPNITEDDIIIYDKDEGFSGGNTNRPDYQRMMNDVKNKKFDAIIFYKLDRIGRSTRDLNDFVDTMKDYGITFISVTEKIDTTTSFGNLYLKLLADLAEFERDTLTERIRDNMYELAKTGRWLGGVTPTGYESKKIENKDFDGRKRVSYQLTTVKKEVDTVKLIYNKFMEFNSLAMTETYLLQNHIRTKNGKKYTRFSIKNILTNPVYLIADNDAYNYFNSFDMDIYSDKEEFNGKHGMMAYRKIEQGYTKLENKRIHKLNEVEYWIVAVGNHKGIISGKEWVKVQNMLAANKPSSNYRKQRSNKALLSGLLRCGNCGDLMRPKESQYVNKKGEKNLYYLCETKEKTRKQECDIANLQGNELDKIVCDKIIELAQDNSTFFKELKKYSKKIQSNSSNYTHQIKDLNDKINKNEKKIQNALSMLLEAEKGVTYDYINNMIEQLHNENENYKSEIEEIEKLSNDYNMSDDIIDSLKEMVLSFAKNVDNMTIEEKRNMIRIFIRKIIWDGENIHIYFYGSDDENIDNLTSKNICPQGDNSKAEWYR